MATHERRVVFFDLDGTLHQQDMFGSFLRYLLRRQPLNALLVLPLLPIIAIALLIKGRAARWPMSLLLWGCTFGHSEARTDVAPISCAGFATMFRLPLVQERLTTYLLSSDADIWLITGSPQPLVEAVYSIRPGSRVNLIASRNSAWLWWLGIDDALSGT
ncbi:haloacid dehalogenase-like hydrolase [Escherichia coli]